jgi:intein/homing endonuclease
MAEEKFVFTTELVNDIKRKSEEGYKISRQEKFWFKNIPVVRRDTLVFKRTTEETLEYLKCKLGVDEHGTPYLDPEKQTLKQSGVQYFSENYCNIKLEDGGIGPMRLRDYQKDILDLFMNNDRSILMASRQVGKTITAAITILYYCIFNNDKNILIAANIKATTDEIISKIKSIYYYLPFWLKPGVTIWNKGEITFGDTKCRIKTSATTKTAAIGNTIDLLYLDEFAHVPNNIAEDFYRSILPTVAAIQDSKVIITSTPNGYNLFWRILAGAEKEDGDPDKNPYSSMRVYWYEVPGRFVTYLRMNEFVLKKYGLKPSDIYKWVKSFGFEEEERDEKDFLIKEGLKMLTNRETEKIEIHVPNNDNFLPNKIKKILEGKESENPLSDWFRSLAYKVNEGTEDEKHLKLLDICDVSSWKEDAIKSIGSVEAFNQEYDLKFLAGSKTLFDGNTMERIKNGIYEFEHIQFDILDHRTFIPYDDLTWIKDRPDLFDPTRVKDYFMIPGIDISEGLGGDYSVINFFRLMPKSFEEFPLNFKSLYDFFKLEQVGIYRCNSVSVPELAELAYIMMFEMFDPEKVGCVLEWNTYGSDFNNSMKNLFNGRNQYSSHVFFRYKHRQDALKPQIGIKLRANKNLFVKDYQLNIRLGNINVHHQQTLHEMTTFIKKETVSGYKYEADAGANDDCVTPDTLIHTKKGIIPIIDVNVGDYVLTHKGRWKKVIKTGKRFSEKISTIKSRKKLDLKLTTNHNIYAIKKNNRSKFIGNHEWINIDNGLNKNYGVSYISDVESNEINFKIDLLDFCDKNKYFEKDGKLYSIMYENKDVINPKQNIINRFIEMDEDFCFMLGYYLAEGCRNEHQITFCGHKNEENFRNVVIKWALKNNISYQLEDVNKNGKNLTLNSKLLSNYFKLFGSKKDKKLPRDLLNISNDKLFGILVGYLMGDATFTSNNMRVCSISPTISFDVYDILLKLGYSPTINKYKNDKGFSSLKNTEIYSVELSEVEKCKLLGNIDSRLKENKNIKYYSGKKRNVSYSKKNGDYYISSITKIQESEYNDYVYNLEVEDDNSYLANGIIVHNCVMTIVETSTVFKNYKFQEMCDSLFQTLPEKHKEEIEKLLKEAPNVEANDYNVLFAAKKMANQTRTGMGIPNNGSSNPYFGKSFGGHGNPYLNGNSWFNNK